MALPICANIDLTKILLLKYSKTKVQWNCPVYAVKMLEEATHADITFEVAAGGSVELNHAVDKYFPEFHNAMKKYQVESTLGSLYICALERNLNHDNSWIYYRSFREGSIASVTCYKYILEHYEEVIMSDNFLETMKQDPGWVCQVVREASSQASRAWALKPLNWATQKRRRTEETIFI
ncbi:hypothetical protein M758_2G186400 [Ceratodon purpureus]|nr:hypothetical protein M758_2G186400 [Ceratodon purpureus]